MSTSIAEDSLDIKVEISLLGALTARSGGRSLELPAKKCRALLAYLAFAPKAHEREKLQGLLWPESPRTQAQASLRQTLLSLRKALPPSHADSIVSHGDSVALDASRFRVDVVEFERCISAPTLASLERLPALCRGPLLHDFASGETPFDEWIEAERARLLGRALGALDQLAKLQLGTGQAELAINACRSALQLEPLHEPAHRALMQAYAADGQHAQALRHYAQLRAVLRDELGVEPDTQTQSVRDRLLRELESEPHALQVVDIERAAHADHLPESSPGAHLDTTRRMARPAHDLRATLIIPSLIGRDTELEALDRLSADAASGSTRRVVVLRGDAGVGKTSLLDAAAARSVLRGARRLRGRAFESEQVLPLALWIDVLKHADVARDDLIWSRISPAARAELRRILPSGDDAFLAPRATHDSYALFEAMLELFAALAHDAPLFVTLDDLQWADATSLRLFSFLARRLPAGTRTCLMGTARAENLADVELLGVVLREIERESQLHVFNVGPLSRADTLHLFESVSASHDHDVTASDLERVWTLSEGNPLVVVESARTFDAATLPPNVALLPLPLRVRDLIRTQVQRLSADARNLSIVAAVIGRECDFKLLARASELTERQAAAAVDMLVRTRMLYCVDDRCVFTHDRVRETLYADLLEPERRVLHANIARALEALYAQQIDDLAGAIGYHFARAGDAASSIRHLTRFAEWAERNYGLEQALSALAECQRQLPALPSTERDLVALDTTVRRARCLLYMGRVSEMEPILAPYDVLIEQVDLPLLRAQFHVYRAMARAFLGDRRGVEEQEPLLLHAAESCSDITTVGLAYAQLSYNAFRAGTFARSIALGRHAVAKLEQGRDPELTAIAWMNMAASQMAIGACHASLAGFNRACAIGEQIRSPRIRAMAAAFRGTVRVAMGEFEAGLAECRSATALAPDSYTAYYAHWSLVRAVAFLTSFGHADPQIVRDANFDASVAVLEGYARADDPTARGWAGLALVALAEAGLASNPERARDQAARALDLLQSERDPLALGWALRMLGNAELALGQIANAHAWLERARDTFETLGTPFDLATTLLARGLIASAQGDRDAAARDLTRASTLFTALEVPWIPAFVSQIAQATALPI